MSSGPQLKAWLTALLLDIYEVSSTLFRIMVPTLLLVKLLEEMGGVELLGLLLGPVMATVGLPESMGLVWATTLLTNIYTGMVIFFNQNGAEQMAVAQVSVLGAMMLVAHALPIETRIAQKAGVRLVITIAIRLFGALFLGFALHHLYLAGNWLQQPAELLWAPEGTNDHLSSWVLAQLKSLAMILVVISLLLTSLKLMRLLGIERLLLLLLQPVLGLIGIGRSATTITMIGLSLGLTFGGGLLIREARAGHIPYPDVFSAMTLLGLCHSVIEDSLLILLLGADVSVIWLRLLFGFLIVAIMARLLRMCSESFCRRYFVAGFPVKK